MTDLDAGQRFHVASGKMVFYWFDAGSTALIDSRTDVVWVPVAGGGRGTLAESFPFSVAAARVRDVLVELDGADERVRRCRVSGSVCGAVCVGC